MGKHGASATGESKGPLKPKEIFREDLSAYFAMHEDNTNISQNNNDIKLHGHFAVGWFLAAYQNRVIP